MGNTEERLRLLAADTKLAVLANLREEVRGRLNAGAPRDLADLLFDLLDAAIAKKAAAIAPDTYISARLSRSSAAETLETSVDSGSFKNAVTRVEEVFGACRPDDYTLMPPDEDRAGVACIEAMVGGELYLLIVRGPTSKARGEVEPDPLLRLIAEYRLLQRKQPVDFHWNLRQTRNFAFTGRETYFEALDAKNGPAVTPGIHILVGLGGVGKSHICVEYAYRHRAAFSVIWWIRATDASTIDEDLRALATDLRLVDDHVPIVEAVTRVRTWLEHNSSWLLIIDNADTPEAIAPVLPGGGSGRIIITSLNPAWRATGQVIEVLQLSESDAALFLERRTGVSADANLELARKLGCLPLALEHAAAYIDATGVTPEQYIDLFRRHQTALLKKHDSHLSPVAATWLVSVEHVQSHSWLAVQLLNIAAHMAPAPIPTVVFEVWIRGLELSLLRLNDIIAALRRYSLINTHAVDVVVHRLLQDVIRANQSRSARRTFQSTALSLVHDVFMADPFSFHSSSTSEYLLPHALVTTAPGRLGSTTSAIHLLVGLSVYFDQRGSFHDVVKVLEEAAKRLHPAIQEHLRLSVLTKLAQSLIGVGRGTEALPILMRAGEIVAHLQPRFPGEFDAKVEFLSTATEVALQLRRNSDALVLIQRAVDIAQQVQLEPGMAARAYGEMARVLTALGRHDEAVVAAQLAVTFDRAMLGDLHPALALRLTALGSAQEAAGRFSEARLAREEALAITRNAYGDDHAMTVRNCIWLAQTLHSQGEHVAALELYDSATTRTERLTPDWTATLLMERARTLNALGRSVDAQADLDQAIALSESMKFDGSFIETLRDLRRQIIG